MAAPMQVSLPPFFSFEKGMTIRLTALDATTGDPVTGVVVSGASLDVDTDDDVPVVPPAQPGTAFAFGDVAA
jgi:hypothetical protein